MALGGQIQRGIKMPLKFKCLDCGKDIVVKYLGVGESGGRQGKVRKKE